MKPFSIAFLVLFFAASNAVAESKWEKFVGQAGPNGWKCHVIQADPENHGPDGINIHDWNGDGKLDLFVNYEEGKYSRLYLSPESKPLHNALLEPWTNSIQFNHGKCEDSGVGDLDNDGDIDYIANGGWVYFNPGKEKLTDAKNWKKMTLFKNERRVPTVVDIDGDGLNDLVVGAQEWYRQPKEGKHSKKNWEKFSIGKTIWPMNCIMYDVDNDGDVDIVVPDRRKEVFWFSNPGKKDVTKTWERHTLLEHVGAMFMTIADVNKDGIEDFVIAGGSDGTYAKKLVILLRAQRNGTPEFTKVLVDQPETSFRPKGIAVLDMDDDETTTEIVVIPKQGEIWFASYQGDSKVEENWSATPLKIPGSQQRKKMDNAYLCDLDGDGDTDIVTTEENGGWGVIWFENPGKQVAEKP